MQSSKTFFDPSAPSAPLALDAEHQAQQRQLQLTKPAGSLGTLEAIAIQFAAWQGTDRPSLERVSLRIFAGDHGVAARGVSAFPQAVTGQMVHNFSRGGAAASVLAKQHGLDFEVWNLGTCEPLPELSQVINLQLAAGSADFTEQEALTEPLYQACLQAGADAVPKDTQLFIGGEMGIGNTTSAAVLMAALYKLDASVVAGRGTGIDDNALQNKIATIESGLARHVSSCVTPEGALRALGGLEIVALCGAYIAAAQRGIPSLIDGFITSVAAAYAVAINPSVRDWFIFAHASAEKAHQTLLQLLNATPLIHLGMRLGEGSGACVALPLINTALQLHNGMATFAEAGVSE